jgi:hypothetical protein
MIVINFSHPLTAAQLDQIAALAGQPVTRLIAAPAQFDNAAAYGPQVAALADACGLTSEEWQTAPLAIVPPALNFITAALLAELHGRMGYFPACVRLAPVAGATPARYEVVEILPLNAIREAARQRR